ncbi:exodeoxyribonuclease III [Chitinophaga sp.]|uniref:exodeoxyribonuclease III n=1 Tax=Chitinophaga sp. TaxID=1869181 RepID=UPI0031D36229
MKIATYNVNGVNGRLPVLIKWLKEAKPDIVCLQELKTPDEKFPQESLEAIGYNAIWHGQKSWNGVAILTKNGCAVEAIYKGLPGDPEDIQSRYIEAKINGIIIACLYLPNGNPAPGPKFDYKMAWYKRLLTKARRLIKKGTPVILVGDYNTVPTELDAHKPERWVNDAVFFPEPRAAFQKLLKQGWIDAIRTLYPEEKLFTYWDYFANAFKRNAGIRMDHFLLSPDLKDFLSGGGVDKHVRAWEKTSDHAPVWIEITDQ